MKLFHTTITGLSLKKVSPFINHEYPKAKSPVHSDQKVGWSGFNNSANDAINPAAPMRMIQIIMILPHNL